MGRWPQDGQTGERGQQTLGWRVLDCGDYFIDLPKLSGDEEGLVARVEGDFRELAAGKDIEAEQVDRELGAIVERRASEEGFYLDREQKKYLQKYARMHAYGFAFLDELLADDSIEEISVIGLNKPAYVFVRMKGWLGVNAAFTDEKKLMEVVNKMASCVGRRITLQNPRLDAMLKDGSRLHASLPPISEGEITIRKFRERPFSPKEIIDGGTVNAMAMAFLSMLMQTDCSLLIAGNTASGKTTTMNALFSFVPANERIIITEETPEISIPHPHQMRMVVNREMGVSLKDLVYDSLRMRPDRMIVGEVRNREEVEALFDVLLGGQARGAYATFHAQSADEAALRLSRFGVERNDLRSMDAVVVQKRMLFHDKKSKKWIERRRMVCVAEGGEHPKPLFLLDGCAWKARLGGSELIEKIGVAFGSSRREVEAELEKRQAWIARAPPDFMGFFEGAQQRFCGIKW